jgi:hypothetical protein
MALPSAPFDGFYPRLRPSLPSRPTSPGEKLALPLETMCAAQARPELNSRRVLSTEASPSPEGDHFPRTRVMRCCVCPPSPRRPHLADTPAGVSVMGRGHCRAGFSKWGKSSATFFVNMLLYSREKSNSYFILGILNVAIRRKIRHRPDILGRSFLKLAIFEESFSGRKRAPPFAARPTGGRNDACCILDCTRRPVQPLQP